MTDASTGFVAATTAKRSPTPNPDAADSARNFIATATPTFK